MPVSLDIYGGLMAQNNKAISEKAYNFHSATSSIREIAEWFIDTMNLGSITNLKTVESVKKLIDDTMVNNLKPIIERIKNNGTHNFLYFLPIIMKSYCNNIKSDPSTFL